MEKTQGNLLTLLFSAFIIIILGVVLIRPVADDVELAKTGSREVLNESVALSAVTATVSNETLNFDTINATELNESLNMDNGTIQNTTGTLAFDNVTEVLTIRNGSMDNVTGQCNVTFTTGFVACNHTSVLPSVLYFEYVHVSGRTETLSDKNYHLVSLDEIRNGTAPSTVITGDCNITLPAGTLVCNNTHYQTAYADYTYNDHSTGSLTYDELVSFDACRNSTMFGILAGTHCNVTLANGAVQVTYDNFTDDLAYIDYHYEPDTYVSNSAARTLLTITILLFAIAVLIVGIGYAIKSFKEGGVM